MGAERAKLYLAVLGPTLRGGKPKCAWVSRSRVPARVHGYCAATLMVALSGRLISEEGNGLER